MGSMGGLSGPNTLTFSVFMFCVSLQCNQHAVPMFIKVTSIIIVISTPRNPILSVTKTSCVRMLLNKTVGSCINLMAPNLHKRKIGEGRV